jgi:hypothetical protein
LLENDQLDVIVEKMFHVSGAMFAISANYLISSSVLRHPKEFSKIIEAKTKQAQMFKNTGTAKHMKNYILLARYWNMN